MIMMVSDQRVTLILFLMLRSYSLKGITSESQNKVQQTIFTSYYHYGSSLAYSCGSLDVSMRFMDSIVAS